MFGFNSLLVWFGGWSGVFVCVYDLCLSIWLLCGCLVGMVACGCL